VETAPSPTRESSPRRRLTAAMIDGVDVLVRTVRTIHTGAVKTAN
jgi:hypothetical protein